MQHNIYGKPNMANLKGKAGKVIFETILNSKAPDLSVLRNEVNKQERSILKERSIKK